MQVVDTTGAVKNKYDYEGFGSGYSVSVTETNFFGYAGQLGFTDDDICPRPPEWWGGWHGPVPPPEPPPAPLSSLVPMRAYAARSLPDGSLGAVAGDSPSSPLFAARLSLAENAMRTGPSTYVYFGNNPENHLAQAAGGNVALMGCTWTTGAHDRGQCGADGLHLDHGANGLGRRRARDDGGQRGRKQRLHRHFLPRGQQLVQRQFLRRQQHLWQL